jgi:hypothetical protein
MIATHSQIWLGAPAPGGLALPDAHPTPGQVYAPRGVYLDDTYLIVADSGNHRILIWHGVPTEDHRPANVVLGQPDFYSEGPAAGGRGIANGMHLPTGVLVAEGRLFVADAWHHRILVWHTVPTVSNTPPDLVIGQPDLTVGEPNRGDLPSATSFYWPYGIAWIAGRFYVADTGNRRVLAWNGLPAPDQPADLLLGQPDFATREENRGGSVTANSFRWPHAIAGDAQTIYIADAGNHRVLGWTPPPTTDRPADVVLGQSDFSRAVETPHIAQGPQRLRFPYAITFEAGQLVVADTANNRVLIWDQVPPSGANHPADRVLGQPNFNLVGENRWHAVAHDSLCWPYGLHLHRGKLAITDSGNNRVMIWDIGG